MLPVAWQGSGCTAGLTQCSASMCQEPWHWLCSCRPSGRAGHPLSEGGTVFLQQGGLTTGQENFSLSQTCVSQCSQTLDSLGMLRKRKALNWNVARFVFPFSCTRME